MAEIKAYFYLSELDEEGYDEYKKLYNKLLQMEQDFLLKLLQTPEAKVIKASSPLKNPDFYIDKVRGYTPSAITVVYWVTVEKSSKQTYRTIEPTILNSLLSSKLLSNAEKREMLEDQGILKRKEVEVGESQD